MLGDSVLFLHFLKGARGGEDFREEQEQENIARASRSRRLTRPSNALFLSAWPLSASLEEEEDEVGERRGEDSTRAYRKRTPFFDVPSVVLLRCFRGVAGEVGEHRHRPAFRRKLELLVIAQSAVQVRLRA